MVDEWCDWGDLPKSSCQHCKDGKRIIGTASKAKLQFGDGEDRNYDKAYPSDSRGFLAKYPGKCHRCRDEINPGDSVMFRDNKLIHGRCE